MSTRDDVADEIFVAESGVVCEYCGDLFAPESVPTTPIPSTTLFECPSCGRWTESGEHQ